MAASAQTLINAAIAAGYDALSTRDLQECLLYAAQSGGGGGGGVTNGNGIPSTAPSGGSGIYTDNLTKKIYVYVNGAWSFTGVTAA